MCNQLTVEQKFFQQALLAHSKNELSLAITHLKKILALNRKNTLALNAMSVVQHDSEDYRKAVFFAEKALQTNPLFPEAHFNLGRAWMGLNNPESAIQCFSTAINQRPDYMKALIARAYQFVEIHEPEQALSDFNSALSVDQKILNALIGKAIAKRLKGCDEEAFAILEGILQSHPDSWELVFNLGNIYFDRGNYKKAAELYQKCLKIKPDHHRVYFNLSMCEEKPPNKSIIKKLNAFLADKGIKKNNRVYLYLALSNYYKKLGSEENYFKYLSLGNDLFSQINPYSLRQDKLYFGKIKTLFEKLKSVDFDPVIQSDLTPVFILGMPRSGTTLIEQVLSSHSDVFGAGELPLMQKLIDEVVNQESFIPEEALKQIRHNYLSKASQMAGSKRIFTDKMPHNFRYIGVIKKALPEAKILHIKRKPQAVCWSNYKTFFASRNLLYSYKIRDTVDFYKLYESYIAYWTGLFGNEIFDIEYEGFTDDPPTQIQNLLAYLSLPFDSACLAPHENVRVVKTASRAQVSKKIFRNSSNEWLQHDTHFQSLLERSFDD